MGRRMGYFPGRWPHVCGLLEKGWKTVIKTKVCLILGDMSSGEEFLPSKANFLQVYWRMSRKFDKTRQKRSLFGPVDNFQTCYKWRIEND